MSILSAHIGHRTVVLDDRRLRCVDCTHLLELTTAPSGSTSTSSRHPKPYEQCPSHGGEFSGNCRCCRSEQIAGLTPAPPPQRRPTADVPKAVARARAALRRQENPDA